MDVMFRNFRYCLCFYVIFLSAAATCADEYYSDSLSALLNADGLFEVDNESTVYQGENLTAISFPLGGIGAGCIQIDGNSDLAIWQIFNNFEGINIADSFFAVRTKDADGQEVVKVMQTNDEMELAPIDSLTFKGEYPFARYAYEDGNLPVTVELEAFNPLIPLNTKDSSIPCAIFNFKVSNTSQGHVEVSLLGSQKNVSGLYMTDDKEWKGPEKFVLIADFEADSYEGWVPQGEAFGDKPSKGAQYEEQISQLKNIRGQGLVNTYNGPQRDKATGTLTSPEIDVTHDFIHFLIGGGAHDTTCVNLLYNGKIIATAKGSNGEHLAWRTWGVAKYRGKKIQIQAVDKETGAWGHILLDYVLMSDESGPNNYLYALGDNYNRIINDADGMSLYMTSDRIVGDVGYGSMALTLLGDNSGGISNWSNIEDLVGKWKGNKPSEFASGPSAKNQTINGAIHSLPIKLEPGATCTVTFVLTWFFPNATHGAPEVWEAKGNMYTNWWDDALDVSRYVTSNYQRLYSQTRLYHDGLYSSKLPRYLLDRISSQVAVLRSKTCFWAKNGYFGGWEGVNPKGGSCHGNCNHVWHYAQAHARLFPEIGRQMRKQALVSQHGDGAIPHRQYDCPPIAFDGQCGDILGAYREHLISADSSWLDRHWLNIKKAMEYTILNWDSDEDGILVGEQWNTMDAEVTGVNTWMGSMYLAALAAAEKMASLQNDSEAAAKYNRIRQSGAKKQDEICWNGEYYIQVPGETLKREYIKGCHIGQVLGEWWAAELGLPRNYPLDHVQSALKALLRYNFKTNFVGVEQLPRKFVADDDSGMQAVCWPNVKDKPADEYCIMYPSEVETGYEMPVANLMIRSGMQREGLMMTKAICDRYNGKLRTGLTPGDYTSWGYSGNPYGDDEAGKFYSRAMNSWSLLLAVQGFIYDGPENIIGFKPVFNESDHKSFFTAAQGWGIFEQIDKDNKQIGRISLLYGQLKIKKMVFGLLKDNIKSVQVTDSRGRQIPSGYTISDGYITVTCNVMLSASESVEVMIK